MSLDTYAIRQENDLQTLSNNIVRSFRGVTEFTTRAVAHFGGNAGLFDGIFHAAQQHAKSHDQLYWAGEARNDNTYAKASRGLIDSQVSLCCLA